MATKELGNLQTKLSLDDKNFNLTSVRSDLKGLRSEMNVLKSTSKEYQRSTEGLSRQSDILSRKYKTQEARVSELRRRYEESKRVKGEDAQQTKNLSAQYNNAVSSLNKTETQLKRVNEQLERQVNPWKRIGTQLDTAGDKMQQFGRGARDFGRNWTMGVSTPILGFGALMVRTGMDFEKSMSQVQATSGATGDDLALLEEKAREMGASTTKSASEAADGLNYMALAGWDTQEMLGGLEPILRLSEAANIDLGRASDLVTDSLSALQLEVSDLPQYLDMVAEASRTSNTSMDQLMDAFLIAGGNFAQFNVPLSESIASLGLLANRGLKGSEAGRAMNAILVNLTSGAGQAGEAMEELGISAFDTEGNFIGLEETLELVRDRTKNMTDEQKAQYISMIAGKEHLKSFQGLLDGLDKEYKDLKYSVADSDNALNEMADTMQDNAAGNVAALKSAFEELSIQFSTHLLPVLTDGVEKLTDLARWFGDLDEKTQKNIITWAGIAAAVGPAAYMIGTASGAVGGLTKGLGFLTTALGGKSGTKGAGGALMRIVSKGGPVGLAIAGFGGLGIAIYEAVKASDDYSSANVEKIEAMQKEIKQTDELINRFNELKTKNELSNSEMLRFMDIQSELAETNAPTIIEKLKDEQGKLLEKSGLTNEEMSEFIGLNNDIIEIAPETEKVISNQGNAWSENTNAVKEYNDEQRRILKEETRKELVDTLETMKGLEEDKARLMKDQEDTQKDIQKNANARLETEGELKGQRQLIKDLEKEIESSTGLQKKRLEDQLLIEIDKKEELLNQLDTHDRLRDKYGKELMVNQEDLKTTREKLKEAENIVFKYEEIILKQVGLNAKKGQGLTQLDNEISKLETQKSQNDDLLRKGQINTTIHQERNAELNEQISKLQSAKGELDQINQRAREDINKDIYLKERPANYWATLDSKLSTPVSKYVNIYEKMHKGLSYADGTNYHPGGPALVGEEGFELAKLGNKWSMLNFGIADLPVGSQVFTHEESKRILRSLNSTPAYAEGISTPGSAAQIERRLQGNNNQPIEVNLEATFISELDGLQLAKGTYKFYKEIDDNHTRGRMRARGEQI
ncbi:phage tail tape measure protein [Halobacillus aidingensis]|uniref:Phage tail tape measure protein, TP901 family, core region n=1 Tax=Halobacillus aidingensis TaxID=240303 RepID=A0A1H0MFG2_HALAD|nr:phage tail tape measure protein [Halobacillus aidingensis]SDO79159.1 phage tail tape measure protein, TP901 family, core region [Halobacillus aidingensis]